MTLPRPQEQLLNMECLSSLRGLAPVSGLLPSPPSPPGSLTTHPCNLGSSRPCASWSANLCLQPLLSQQPRSQEPACTSLAIQSDQKSLKTSQCRRCITHSSIYHPEQTSTRTSSERACHSPAFDNITCNTTVQQQSHQLYTV